MEPMKHLVGSTSLCYVFQALAAVLPASHCLLIIQLPTKNRGEMRWDERERCLCVSILHSWESSLTCSHFFPWDKSQAEKGFLGTELCCLGGGVMQTKSNYFPSLSNVFGFRFFVPMVCWNFSIGLLDFHEGSFLCG